VKTVEYWLARFVLATLSATSLSTANALARSYVRLLDMALPRLRRTALNRNKAGLWVAKHHHRNNGRAAGGGLARFPQLLRQRRRMDSRWA
jgi:hypothetical protein